MQILPELQLQNLDQTLCFEQKLSFLTKPQLRNFQQVVDDTILLSNSYNINKFCVGFSHTRVTSIKFTKQQSVSQQVGEH